MAEHPDEIIAPSIECFERSVRKVVRITFIRLSIVLLTNDVSCIDCTFSFESAQLHMPREDIIKRAILESSLHKFHSMHLSFHSLVALDISHVLIENCTIVFIIDIHFFCGLNPTLARQIHRVILLSLFHYNFFILF